MNCRPVASRREDFAEPLSGAWFRQAAQEKLAAEERRTRLETVEQLRAFFASCDERESDREPDWAEHRKVIESSQRAGLDTT